MASGRPYMVAHTKAFLSINWCLSHWYLIYVKLSLNKINFRQKANGLVHTLYFVLRRSFVCRYILSISHWWFVNFNIKFIFPDPEPPMISIQGISNFWPIWIMHFGIFFCFHIKTNYCSILYLLFTFRWLISVFFVLFL